MWFLTGLFIFVGFVTFRPPQQMFQNVAVEEGTFSRVRDVAIVMIALLFFLWVITLKPSRWFRNRRKRKTPCLHCFQCGRKYEQKKKVEVLSQQLNVKDDQFHQLTLENQVLSEGLQNVSNNLSEVQLHLQERLQRHGEEQEKAAESFQQVEALSQRLSLKDDQLGEITMKNNELSEDLENITSKFSAVQLQLEMQQQQQNEEQQKNIESCQQVELLSQQLLTKDGQYSEMTYVLNVLLEHNTDLDNKFCQLEQHLQEQREKQEKQNVEHHGQVKMLETDLKSKDKCLEAMVFKHNESIKAMYELYKRIQQLEQRRQDPRHGPRSQFPRNQGKPQQQQIQQSNPQHDQRQQNKGPRVIKHMITSGVELKSTHNAWRPIKKEDVSSPAHDITRQFRSLLNKITPENFDRLIQQIKLIHIANEDNLKDVVQLVLDKAVMESKFSEVYANLCHHLAKIEVKETGSPDNIFNFHTHLLQSCTNEVKKGIDVSSSLDDAASKEKARRRALGNIVFIGELFIAKVFNESLISTTVKGLLDDGSELSLECFCRLVGVVGKILDSTQASMMNGYFSVLDKLLLKERKISTRIRFMLQDLMDLRVRNWIPRQKVERPTYLQNIREEADAQQP